MSLDLSKLEKVRPLTNGGVEARCPACAEAGHDHKGEHLIIKPDGRFGCCANPKDRQHRKRIFALAGDTARRSIKVKPAVAVPMAAITSDVFGRLGRLFPSPATPDQISDGSDGVNEVQLDSALARTPRTGCSESNQNERGESRTFRTPQYPYTCGEKDIDMDTGIKVQGVAVGASEASELLLGLEFEKGVRSVREGKGAEQPPKAAGQQGRMPYLTPGGVLGIPFDSPERFHWWKGGQSIAETRAEVESWMAAARNYGSGPALEQRQDQGTNMSSPRQGERE
jgi:hypothetical protein